MRQETATATTGDKDTDSTTIQQQKQYCDTPEEMKNRKNLIAERIGIRHPPPTSSGGGGRWMKMNPCGAFFLLGLQLGGV